MSNLMGSVGPEAALERQQTFQALNFRHATWLELFFDLVFVAVVGVMAHELGHTHQDQIEKRQLVSFFGVVVPILWVWSGHTIFANRYDTDSLWQRFCAIALMALVLLTSLFMRDVQGGGSPGFIVAYAAMQAVVAAAYFTAPRTTSAGDVLAHGVGWAIVAGVVVSGSSLFAPPPFRLSLIFTGIALQILLMARLRRAAVTFPVHRSHLIERIGLFAIIVLGETILRIVGSFTARERYDIFDVVAAAAGFLLIVLIWWIYFGAFHLLERARRIRSGFSLILSQLMVFVGMIFLANLTGHAINGDLSRQAFANLGLAGAALFYVGKQIPYFLSFPPHRIPIIVNTFICMGITVAATFLPRPEYSLVVMCFGMLVYVQLNLQWTIPLHNVEAYLTRKANPSRAAFLEGARNDP